MGQTWPMHISVSTPDIIASISYYLQLPGHWITRYYITKVPSRKTSIYCHSKFMRLLPSPHLHQPWVLSLLEILGNLIDKTWYLILVLICMSFNWWDRTLFNIFIASCMPSLLNYQLILPSYPTVDTAHSPEVQLCVSRSWEGGGCMLGSENPHFTHLCPCL